MTEKNIAVVVLGIIALASLVAAMFQPTVDPNVIVVPVITGIAGLITGDVLAKV
jgi:hypothetical protein